MPPPWRSRCPTFICSHLSCHALCAGRALLPRRVQLWHGPHVWRCRVLVPTSVVRAAVCCAGLVHVRGLRPVHTNLRRCVMSFAFRFLRLLVGVRCTAECVAPPPSPPHPLQHRVLVAACSAPVTGPSTRALSVGGAPTSTCLPLSVKARVPPGTFVRRGPPTPPQSRVAVQPCTVRKGRPPACLCPQACIRWATTQPTKPARCSANLAHTVWTG